ncbi:MAG: anti-sigma factor antagonist [Candidatus Omnitrophota bacterium]|jgi:anti-anti-sigma factor
MEIRARQKGNIIILELAGRIDVNSANLVEAVGQCVRDGYNEVLCNLEDIEFIDYMGVSVIVIAYKEVVNNNGRMKFCCVPAHLKGVFSVAGLERVMEFYATEDLALETFNEDKVIEKIQKLQLRRRFKRLPIDIKIEIKQKRAERPVCLNADILNLSAIGAYIYGCSKFKLGDELLIKLKLSPKGEEIELNSKVVWLPDKQVQPQTWPGMGVEFINLSGSVQQKLLEFIERNLSFMSSD